MIEHKLQQKGFSRYEAAAYAVLLRNGQLTAGELSRLAGIPQGRIYGVLEGLEKRGFCSVILGSVKSYRVVNPRVAFDELMNQQRKALTEMEALQEELEAEYNIQGSQSADFFQVLTSKVGQVEKFDELISRCQTTLCSFNKKPYATGFTRTPEQIRADSRPIEKLVARGARARALFEAETDSNLLPFANMVKYYSTIGEEVRITGQLPLKMLLIDGLVAMVSLQNNDASKFKLTSMVVEHTDLTGALNQLFDLYWEKAEPLHVFLEKHHIDSKPIID